MLCREFLGSDVRVHNHNMGFLLCSRLTKIDVLEVSSKYRVFNQLVDLGGHGVDLDLECSTILPSSFAVSAEIPSDEAQSGR